MNRYKLATLELESLAEEKERLMSVLYSVTSDPSDDGGGNGGDKIGDGVARLVDLVRSLDDEIKSYIDARDDVRSVVREVMHRDITLGQCLHHRYIAFDDPATCASRMGYDTSSERRLHRRALEAAMEIAARSGKLPENTRSNRDIV